jgi:hypothetical protein
MKKKIRKIFHVRGQGPTNKVKVVYPNWEITSISTFNIPKERAKQVTSIDEKIITNGRSNEKLWQK